MIAADMDLAVGRNQWYHFGVGAPPILVYFSGGWDVDWGYDLDFDPWPHVSRSFRFSEVNTEDRRLCEESPDRESPLEDCPW